MISDVISGIFCVIYPAVCNVLMIQADLIGHGSIATATFIMSVQGGHPVSQPTSYK